MEVNFRDAEGLKEHGGGRKREQRCSIAIPTAVTSEEVMKIKSTNPQTRPQRNGLGYNQ